MSTEPARLRRHDESGKRGSTAPKSRVARRSLPLSISSLIVVLAAGLLTLSATALLWLIRFLGVPPSLGQGGSIEAAQHAFLASLGLIGAVFLMLSALAAWLSVRAFAGDLSFVTRRVRALFERGDLGEPIALRTLDEVGALTRAFEELRRGYLEQLSRERAAHRQAQEADLYKSEFLTTVSHELRTPLNAILGFTEVLLAELEGPLTDGQREDLRMIRASGEHLLALFNNVLEVSALASGRIKLHPERVDVALLLEEVASLLAGQRQNKPVQITVAAPNELPPLQADATRLRQIVLNLGTNALKYTQAGEVALRAEQVDQAIRISVRDTGIGIAAEDLPRLFAEFTQVGTHGRERPGSGLGLSIVQKLTRLHGGHVEVESALGHGSTFSVTLPLTHQALPSDPHPDDNGSERWPT
ncbi:MAG: sensory box histidine kinase/response regulator [Myxococcaceae bacterium]|nr:sensory box histidine kinase/response regulator [Myxococcaceae bacterium]